MAAFGLVLSPQVLAFFGLALLASAIPYFLSNKKQRDAVFATLGFQKQPSRESFTPPRSLSPAKQGLPANTPPDEAPYKDVFPPHRRSALAEIKGFKVGKKTGAQLSLMSPDTSKCVPNNDNVYDPKYAKHITPPGFTMEEVVALGDFPDYAALSGVPLPKPYKEFDFTKAKPRPYRPFRWAYHQTMSISKLEQDWWLELESTYVERIKQRKGLYEKYGEMVLQALPGSELGTKELMEMVLQFLCARYPQYFSLSADKKTFHNGILKADTDLKNTPPLVVLLNNVPEDFAMMYREPETGFYEFRAGVICSSLGWNVGTKIGKKLHEIHEPIPDYKEKMQFSMDRYFSKKPTDKPIQRGSWGLEIDEPLFMPPGDPHEKLREVQDPTHTIDRCNLRVDWQTLRRLPLSGSVVFSFKALFTPVTEFRDEPYIPSICLKVLKEGKKNLMQYKGTWHTEHVVVPALEEWEKEQVEKGLIEKDWEAHTLDESPWFPGWEEKWHRQQGY